MSAAASALAAGRTVWTTARARLLSDFVLYFACSAVALALDYGLLLLLTRLLGVHYLIASAIGFLAGLGLVYALSVALVFRDRRVLRPGQEFAGFAGIGIAGLALTQLSLAALVGGLGIGVALAKPATAILVFLFNFAARRTMLFSPAATAPAGGARP